MSSAQCPSPEINDQGGFLTLIFNKETQVYALVNTTSQVAIVFQIGQPIALIANGKTGASIVINIKEKTVVYYPAGANQNLWQASQLDLVDYLNDLGPLTNVNNWNNGQSSNLTSVPKEVKNILISIIKKLDIEIAIRVNVNPDSIISLISVLIKGLLESKNVIQHICIIIESPVIVIYGGLSKLVNLIVGLDAISKYLQGGIQSIIKNGTDIAPVLGENSGFNSLIDFLLQTCVHADLTKILGNLLQRPEGILKLVVELDRGIYSGISGIFAVVYNVQLYATKKISLEALIDVIIQVQACNAHFKIAKKTLNEALYWYFILAESQKTQFHTETSWLTLNKFFQDIKDDKLVIKGINVSAIINELISTSGSSSLCNVVKVLRHLSPAVSLSKIIATLYCRFVHYVVFGHGLIFIDILLPQIPIKIDFASKTSILKQILSKVNVGQIVSYLLRLDVVGAISSLPVFGTILKEIDGGIKDAGVAAGVTVTSSLKATNSILTDLKDLILYGLGRGVKAPVDLGVAGLSVLGGGTSVSITTTWTSSASFSSSKVGSVASGGLLGGFSLF